MSTYQVPGTILGAWAIILNTIDDGPANILMGEKHMAKIILESHDIIVWQREG